MAERKRSTPTMRRERGKSPEEEKTTEKLTPLSFGFLERRAAARKKRGG